MLFGFVAIATVALVYLSAARLPSLSDLRPRAAASPTALVEPPALPTRAATPALALAPPKPVASPTPTPAPEPSPTTAPARYVRVANTNGIGVYLREEPGAQSQRVQPPIAEGALLRLVGPEQTVQAQIWRLCELEGRDVQGWAPAQYLQAVEITPTPGRP
ncbi:MAG: hypothetical protein U0893_17640 [Chloroflexota bacterium]